jgi:PAS domain S-box-containing protein
MDETPFRAECRHNQDPMDALRESEARFRTLAECAPVVVWLTDANNRCTYISKHWREFTGRDPEQDLGFRWVEALHPGDRDRAARDLIEAAESGQPCRGEYRVKRADGEYGWLSDFGVPYFNANGSYAGHIGTCMDITGHKNRERAGHKVQDNLLLGQEAERRRLARELHDDIGQRIGLLAVALNEIAGLVPSASPVLDEKLRTVRRDVELIASEIHRLSRNLHPATVTQLGLVAALRQLCREFSEQMHIAVEFAGGSLVSPMSEEASLALFRVSQECLANIAKHSKSHDVQVSLSESPGEVLLTIADRGIGFDVALVHASGGLGLVSIQERARMIGAHIEIRSVYSQGTTVELRVPTPTVGL